MADVLVMGRSVGALMAAHTLARSNLKVTLIDPGTDQLAEDFAAGAAKHQLQQHISESGPWIRNHISMGRLISPNGHSLELRDSSGGYVISPVELSTHLLRLFVGAPGSTAIKTVIHQLVSLDESHTCFEGTTPRGRKVRVDCRIVILSAGAAALLTNASPSAGAEPMAYVQYHLPDQTLPQRLIEIYVGRLVAPESYIWVISWGSEGGVMLGWGVPVPAGDIERVKSYLETFVKRKVGNVEMVPRVIPVPAPRESATLVGQRQLIISEHMSYAGFLPGVNITDQLELGRSVAEVTMQYLSGHEDDSRELSALYLERLRPRDVPIDRLEQLRRVASGISDEEMDDLISGVREVVGDTRIAAIDPLPTLLRAIKKKPRLWKLARFLF